MAMPETNLNTAAVREGASKKVLLRSKSVHEPRSPEDGVRICVMRRIKENFDFDMWLPVLAPSEELLRVYNDGKVGWDDYVKMYTSEVLNNRDNGKFFRMLRELALEGTVTLLCHEKTDEMCHRRLIIDKVMNLR
jgi:uncharacterized protein YeaO (DUF488 family)